MTDDDGQTEGCEVPKTNQFKVTAIKGRGSRPGEQCGAVKFPDADEKLRAVPRAKKLSSAPDVADQIGLRLRIVYDDVLTQPVPDRFFELLRQLEGDSGSSTRNDL